MTKLLRTNNRLRLPIKRQSASLHWSLGIWSLAIFVCRGGGTRTHNPWFWRPVLCQLSYAPGLNNEALMSGGEIATAISCLSFRFYSTIFVTTPEPTVLPPSRIAKRTPSSIAIGFCSSTEIFALSPGMHISASPTKFAEPVTSVVRK